LVMHAPLICGFPFASFGHACTGTQEQLTGSMRQTALGRLHAPLICDFPFTSFGHACAGTQDQLTGSM